MANKPWHTVVIVSTLAVLLVVLARAMRHSNGADAEPRTREQVIAIAERLNLFWVEDGCAGGRLIVSELPITTERESKLRLNDYYRAHWIGCVAVYPGWRQLMPNYNPACTTVWGEFFVYGDATFIARLTGRHATP